MTPFAAIRRSRHNRLGALVALLALLFATTAYVSHGSDHSVPLPQHSSAQCDLCLHFSGTAGAPDHPAPFGLAPLPAFAPTPADTQRPASYEHPTHRLPRAPPALTFS
jgi:hypothetical protein